MKIALCFYGLHPLECLKEVRGIQDKTFEYWNKNIINNNDVDVFMHSFSVDKKKDLLRYKPKKYIIEKQKKFDIINSLDLSSKNQKNQFYDNMNWFEIMFSVAYGMKTSVNLMTEYEQEHNFTYDIVILSRLDVIWLQPIVFQELNKDLFYSSIWGKDNYYSKEYPNELLGYWFISNSKFIKQYSLLYDTLKEYIQNGIKKSYHVISKYHIKTFTNNIEYKFNDHWNDIVHHSLQRYLYKQRIPF